MQSFVFAHVCPEDEKGRLLSERELSSFVASIALSVLDEKGERGLSALRLLSSDSICLVSPDKIIVVPFAMYPESAELSALDKEEAECVARNMSLPLFSLPISLACLSGDFSEALSGSDFAVKISDVEKA